ncbi:hypothetical protein AKO1_015776, partial [Acrasis kona]
MINYLGRSGHYRSLAAEKHMVEFYEATLQSHWKGISYEHVYFQGKFGATHTLVVNNNSSLPIIVLLHGICNTSLMWADIVRKLSPLFKIYCIDIIFEPGLSKCIKPITMISECCAWLNELLNQISGHNPVSLVGFSYGGYIAAEYTNRFPSKISKLTLINPAATFSRTSFSHDTLLVSSLITGSSVVVKKYFGFLCSSRKGKRIRN